MKDMCKPPQGPEDRMIKILLENILKNIMKKNKRSTITIGDEKEGWKKKGK